MAIFNINTIPSDWSVTKTEISTDCSTRFQYKVVAPAGHVIDISLIGDHLDQYAESNGQELYLPPAGTTGIVFNNTLSFYFIIPNSGVSGSFLDSQVVITNNNSTNADPVYTNTATRENDDQNCDDKGSGGGFGGESREMHKATCSECKNECEVPFKPSNDRPIYCKECFAKRKNDNR